MNIDAFQCSCNCSQYRMPDVALQIIVDAIEEHFGEEVVITSGYRCKDKNQAVGGSPRSLHRYGKAIDFYLPSHELEDVHAWLDSSGLAGGLGIYNTHIHVDSRAGQARWDYRT